MIQKYQQRTACPFCERKIKPLQMQAHIRLACPKAPTDERRVSVSVSVKGKWRPRGE